MNTNDDSVRITIGVNAKGGSAKKSNSVSRINSGFNARWTRVSVMLSSSAKVICVGTHNSLRSKKDSSGKVRVSESTRGRISSLCKADRCSKTR